MRLALFLGIIGAASVFDARFDQAGDSAEKENKDDDQQQSSNEHGVVYLFSQYNPVTISAQKISSRKPVDELHDRLLQKYHEVRNSKFLKPEENIPKVPLYLAFHNLVFRNSRWGMPDDEPPLV